MPDAAVVEGIRNKYVALVDDLDERGRRRWAAAEAMSLGRGGIAAVCAATGMSDRTVRTGVKELQESTPLSSSRQRRPGGGRKSLEDCQPDLITAVEALIEPSERGDPESPLRWTCKSLRNLQTELQGQGYQIGRTKIAGILKSLGYSLQGNRKTREGKIIPTVMHSSSISLVALRLAAEAGDRPCRSTRRRRKTSGERQMLDESTDRRASL